MKYFFSLFTMTRSTRRLKGSRQPKPALASSLQPTAGGSKEPSLLPSDQPAPRRSKYKSRALDLSSGEEFDLNLNDLNTTTDAKTALTNITAAINSIAASRGAIGASVNQLTADTNVENTEVQNLTSAQNNVQNANIAATTSNLTQYNILEQTGFDALSQSNSAEQNVLKLLQ